MNVAKSLRATLRFLSVTAFVTGMTLLCNPSQAQDYASPYFVYSLPTFCAGPLEQARSDAIFRELLAGLPKDGDRAKSARQELDYWHNNRHWNWIFSEPPIRRSVRTKDGKAAEVLLLTTPALSMPGTDFSMAFLLVEKRVIDWASCWTYNRTANQELLLEDVDGDGFLDVAFRATRGWYGLVDKRQHSRPGQKKKWLYAYAITSTGFQSLFPLDQELTVTPRYDSAGEPVKLEVKGLPKSFREQQMVECTFSATNTSKKDVALAEEWFKLSFEKAGYLMVYGPVDKRPILKPGQTISQVVGLVLDAKEEQKEVILRFSFVPASP